MNELEVASNPTTTPDALRLLVHSKEPAVLRALASNPNIPPDLVALLLRPFPFEIVANPAWQLVLLERPGFIEREVSHFTIAEMLMEKELPGVLLNYFAQHKSSFIRRRVVQYRARD